MSLLEKASLIITPNAEKAGKLYSVIPSDGSGDLTVVRGTTATRVNSLGLIENVAVNEPRLNYETVGGCPAILIEPQRTNLSFFSENYENSFFTKVNTTVTSNATTSPSGLLTADKIVENTLNGNHGVQVNNSTITTITSYTTTFFVKKAEKTNFVLWVRGLMSANRCMYTVDLNLKTITFSSTLGNFTRVSESIKEFPNDWFLISTTITVATGETSISSYIYFNNLATYIGNGVDGLFVWGGQIELGAYPTSYIPTLGSAQTRNLDNISKTGVNALIGQTEGTIFAEVRISRLIGTVSRYIFHISDGTANNRIYIAFSGASSNIIRARIFNAGNLETTIETSTITTTGRYKLALAYKNNDVVFYVNGVQIGTDVTASIPACSRVDLGQNYIAASQFSDSIINPNIFKTRLTNTELQNLTTL